LKAIHHKLKELITKELHEKEQFRIESKKLRKNKKNRFAFNSD